MTFPEFLTTGAATAFVQVVFIDLALAGDNAMAVGIVAAGLPKAERRRAIVLGLGGAVVMLIGFALIAAQLLKVVGLSLAGGFILLWVCWKMWRDLREQGQRRIAEGEAALEGEAIAAHGPPATTLAQALRQILLADLAMSLDNVLAVSAAAKGHLVVLAVGLLLSITITGLAASWIAKLLHRFRWIGYIGLVIVIWVAGHMIWDGTRTVAIDTGQTHLYNRAMPDALDIHPSEVVKRKAQ
ncbi:TerC family protein [Phenylobacterium sp.]|uniref:TerC family protein n=1 Tax=Phenylobacterium sp. TaxID=1871053 RepID=UPI002C7556B5|nr:TerC family protein [Phenylobacterium sp.]HLZ76684.1 TerC family protein [Phenylobacterium sp.]